MLPGSTDYVELLFHWHRYHIAAGLAQGKTVLDLGCGEGYGAYHMAQFARELVAVDIDVETVQKAKMKYVKDNLSFLPGSAMEIPSPDSFFDLVVSFEMIEHLDEKNQKKSLQEITRVLKSGGVFLVSTPDKRRTDKFPQKNPYHIKEFYLEDFSALLKQYFKYVDLYFQEINLASLVWPADSSDGASYLQDFKIKCDVNRSSPANQNMDIYMYVVAACTNDRDSFTTNVASVCYDVKRRPVEVLWEQNGSLAFRCEQLEKQNTVLKNDINSLRRENAGYIKKLEKLGSENKLLAEENCSLHRQNKHLAGALSESRNSYSDLEVKYSGLKSELEAIYNSRTWKVVRKYRHVMDHTFLGNILRPLRAFLLFILRKFRR